MWTQYILTFELFHGLITLTGIWIQIWMERKTTIHIYFYVYVVSNMYENSHFNCFEIGILCEWGNLGKILSKFVH